MPDEAPKPEEHISLIPADLKFEDAFNWKTVMAALFVGIVMLPGAMYMGLVAGVGLGGAAEWVTVILFLEVARRTFVQLRTQELMLIYATAASIIGVSGAFGSGLQLFGGSFGLFIWEQYLVQHPLMSKLAPKIPDWVVPPIGSGVYAMRTFFHVAWIKPIVIGLVVAILWRVNSLTLGYVLFRVTADAERLPFPLANISVAGSVALAESSSGKEGWRWRVFSIGAMIGVAWGMIYVVVPVLTSVIAPSPILLIPIPWIDLTREIQAFLPGALFGLSTGLGSVFFGMVLPGEIAWGQCVGSIVGGILLPPILVWNGLIPDWKPGYTTIPTSIAMTWNFWISFGAGIGIVFGWAGLIATIRRLMKDRKARRESGQVGGSFFRLPAPPEGRGDFNMPISLMLWAASVIGLVFAVKLLVPEFPVWITAVFGLLWSPINSYITARMVGISSSVPGGNAFPFLRELTFISSGYKGVALWFAPVPLYDVGWEARGFREFELARVKFMSMVKLAVLTTILMLIFSCVYWSLIWKLGPIPSSSYPYAQKMWPLGVQNQYIWLSITDPESPQRAYFLHNALNAKRILFGAGTALALWGITSAMRLPALFFFSMIGSFALWPHDSIPLIVGALIGMAMARRFGKEKWEAYAPILAAGFGCGMGLIGMVGIGIALISKAVTPLLY